VAGIDLNCYHTLFTPTRGRADSYWVHLENTLDCIYSFYYKYESGV